MDTLEAIRTRRSIRRYAPRPVPDAVGGDLLRAAMSAPSAGNQQPWQFVVITDPRLREEIPTFHPYAQMLREAPLAILVCGDLQRESYKGYWVQDCSAATQNLLLAAHAKGLGAVWLGVHPREERIQELSRLLGLPEQVPPLAVLSIGYPAEHKKPAERYDESRIHRDRW